MNLKELEGKTLVEFFDAFGKKIAETDVKEEKDVILLIGLHDELGHTWILS